jgi:hypothetical protein
VDNDRHSVPVRRSKQLTETFDMLRVVVVDSRVAKMQFEAAAQVRIFRAPRQLVEGVVLERVEAAESDETIGELSDLRLVQSLSALTFS